MGEIELRDEGFTVRGGVGDHSAEDDVVLLFDIIQVYDVEVCWAVVDEECDVWIFDCDWFGGFCVAGGEDFVVREWLDVGAESMVEIVRCEEAYLTFLAHFFERVGLAVFVGNDFEVFFCEPLPVIRVVGEVGHVVWLVAVVFCISVGRGVQAC